MTEVGFTSELDGREQQEVELSKVYVEKFNHGTSGHLAYRVIYKLQHRLSYILDIFNKRLQLTDEEWTVRAASAYEAYGDEAGWKTYDDRDMPAWGQIGLNVQQRWVAAVKKVYADLGN